MFNISGTSITIILLLLQVILLQGCNPVNEESNSIDTSAFLHLVKANNFLQVKQALDTNPQLAHAEDEYGSSAINIAVHSSSLDIIRDLLNAGADPNHYCNVTGLPLNDAAYFGLLNKVKLLIDKGADPKRTRPDTGYGTGGNALHYAAGGGSLEVVQYLVTKGMDINALDVRTGEFTVLHWAVSSDRYSEDRLDIIRYLVVQGADTTIADRYGKTPLDYAIVKKRDKAYIAALSSN